MKSFGLLIIWATILIFTMTGCSQSSFSLTEKNDSSKSGVKTTNFQASQSSPTQTPTLSITTNPIYTAIFLAITPTYTSTIYQSPTITPTPSMTPLRRATRGPTRTAVPIPTFLPLKSHVYTDVAVYYGDKHRYLFSIVGISDYCRYLPSKRGIYVAYPGGEIKWRDRDKLIKSGLYFVRGDDPNIPLAQTEYYDCP